MATVTETPTKVKPARIGYFTIRGSRERNPLGFTLVGVSVTIAAATATIALMLSKHQAALGTRN